MIKYFNSKDARSLIDTYGFSIFPIHGVKEDGTCTCNNPTCTSIGKHPATPDGFKSASPDMEQVKRMWAGRKGLNVGIATGAASGIFVVDIDDPDAEIELRNLIEIPETFTVKTGRGKHLYFKYDENRPVKNGANVIKGVDIRGDGGYVAGAGSNHSNGAVYTVKNPLEVFADAPEELYKLLEPKPYTSNVNESPASLNLLKSALSTPSDGWSVDDMRDHLSHISPDMPHDDWVKVGMALQSEGDYYNLFDEWSSRGSTYEGPRATQAKWNSFSSGGGITYGTVVALAKEGGWVPKKKPSVLTAPPSPLLSTPEVSEIVDEETGEVKPRTLYYHRASSMTPSFDVNDFVQNTLTEGAMSVVYGESNCGKTFFASDLAFHIVEGKEWRDRAVEKGGALYVSMEGAFGLKNRIAAYKSHTGAELDDLLVMPCTVDFVDPEGNINEFIDILKDAMADAGDLKIIFIDTLARAVGGGDENSGQDMGMLVRHADIIREYTKAHICFIHHSGKDKAKGARGHSSLRAAVDTEIEISRNEGDDFSNVKFSKQRDMEMAEDLQFKLERVVLGKNKRDEEIASCIVSPYEATQSINPAKMTPVQTFLYNSLVYSVDTYGAARTPYKGATPVKCVSYDELREVMEERGFKEIMKTNNKTTAQQVKSTTQTARLALQKMNKISFNGRYIWLVGQD